MTYRQDWPDLYRWHNFDGTRKIEWKCYCGAIWGHPDERDNCNHGRT